MRSRSGLSAARGRHADKIQGSLPLARTGEKVDGRTPVRKHGPRPMVDHLRRSDAQRPGTAGTLGQPRPSGGRRARETGARIRSEEHTSELQSLMRISYAVFCLKKKKNN